MSLDPSEIQVLVPDGTGSLSLCSVADLYQRSDEFDTLDDLTMQTAIDTVELPSSGSTPRVSVDEFLIKIAAVSQLNETGDAAAYWGL